MSILHFLKCREISLPFCFQSLKFFQAWFHFLLCRRYFVPVEIVTLYFRVFTTFAFCKTAVFCGVPFHPICSLAICFLFLRFCFVPFTAVDFVKICCSTWYHFLLAVLFYNPAVSSKILFCLEKRYFAFFASVNFVLVMTSWIFWVAGSS